MSNNCDARRGIFAQKLSLDICPHSCYHLFMGVITKIEAQKRARGRVNVYVDGEFAVALEAVTAKSEGLEVGTETTAETLARIAGESECESALRRAFGYVAKRMRTESEVEKYLRGKMYSDRAVSSAVSKLKGYGYIDDGEFVRSYVEAKGGTRGKLRIKRDLALLGADERMVEEAVCSLGDQREAAARAAEKYLRLRPYDYRKLCAHLSSKGFEWEDIRAAVRGLGKETEDEGSV